MHHHHHTHHNDSVGHGMSTPTAPRFVENDDSEDRSPSFGGGGGAAAAAAASFMLPSATLMSGGGASFASDTYSTTFHPDDDGSSSVNTTTYYNNNSIRRRAGGAGGGVGVVGGAQLVTHSEGKTFACHICSAIFISSEDVTKHIAAMHNVDVCDGEQRLQQQQQSRPARSQHRPVPLSSMQLNEHYDLQQQSILIDTDFETQQQQQRSFAYKASFSRYCVARADTHYKLSFTILTLAVMPPLGLYLCQWHPRFPLSSVLVIFSQNVLVLSLLVLSAWGPLGDIEWQSWSVSVVTYGVLTLALMIFHGWEGSVEYIEDDAVQDVVKIHLDRKLFVPVKNVHGGKYYQNSVRRTQSARSLTLAVVLAVPHALQPWEGTASFTDRSGAEWAIAAATFISAVALLKRAIDGISVAHFHVARVQRFSLLTHMSFFPDSVLVFRTPVDAYDGWELTFYKPQHLIRWMSLRQYLQAVSLPFLKALEGLMAVLVVFLVATWVYFVIVRVGDSLDENEYKRTVYSYTLFYDVVAVAALTSPLVFLCQKLNDLLRLHQRMIVECEYLLVVRASTSHPKHVGIAYARCHALLRALHRVMSEEDKVRLLGFELKRVTQFIFVLVACGAVATGGLYAFI